MWHCLHICKKYFSIWLSNRQLDSHTCLYTQSAAICCSGCHLWWKSGVMHTGTFKVEPESVLGIPGVLRSCFENHWFKQLWHYHAHHSCGPWGGDQAELRIGERWLGGSHWVDASLSRYLSPLLTTPVQEQPQPTGSLLGQGSVGMERSYESGLNYDWQGPNAKRGWFGRDSSGPQESAGVCSSTPASQHPTSPTWESSVLSGLAWVKAYTAGVWKTPRWWWC